MGDVEFADVHKMSRDGCSSSHHRTNQMRAAIFALASLEIAVRCTGTALVRWQDIRVHANTHAAARVAPLESCFAENLVEPFFLRLRLDAARTLHNQLLFDFLRHVLSGHAFST